MNRSRTPSVLERVIVVLCSAGLVLPSVPAFAAGAGAGPEYSPSSRSVVAIDLSVEEKEHAEILREVRVALGAHTDAKGRLDYVVKSINGPLNAGGEATDASNIATAKGFADAGAAAFAAGEFEDASEHLESAAQLFSQSYGTLSQAGRAQYAQLLLMLGAAQMGNGDTDAAGKSLFRAVDFKADGSALKGDIRAAFDEAKRAHKASARGAIQVNSDPAYAEVYVDGHYKGISPVMVAGLTVGPHIVTVHRPGYTRPTTRVDVSETRMAHRDIVLSKARRKLLLDQTIPKVKHEIESLGDDEPTGGVGVGELGTLFGSDTAVLVNIEGTPEVKSLEIWLFHIPTKRMVGHNKVEGLDWGYRNSEAVAAAVNSALDVDWAEQLGADVTVVEDPSEESGGIASKWWFWTIIGVAVAGGVTAAVVLSGSETSEPPYGKNGKGAVVLSF